MLLWFQKLIFCLEIPHYSEVIMSAMASQITGVSFFFSAACSGADQSKHQSPASLALCERTPPAPGGPEDSPHKGPATRKMFPFDDVIMRSRIHLQVQDAKVHQDTLGVSSFSKIWIPLSFCHFTDYEQQTWWHHTEYWRLCTVYLMFWKRRITHYWWSRWNNAGELSTIIRLIITQLFASLVQTVPQ